MARFPLAYIPKGANEEVLDVSNFHVIILLPGRGIGVSGQPKQILDTPLNPYPSASGDKFQNRIQ